MNRIRGFTAEGVLFEGAQRHYGTPGVARSSGTVKPAFRLATDPHFLNIQLLHLKTLQECLLCCLGCGPGKGCICLTGGCECLPPIG